MVTNEEKEGSEAKSEERRWYYLAVNKMSALSYRKTSNIYLLLLLYLFIYWIYLLFKLFSFF